MMTKPLKLTVYVHGDIDDDSVGRAVTASTKAIRDDPGCWCMTISWDTKRGFFQDLHSQIVKQWSGWRIDVTRPKAARAGEP